MAAVAEEFATAVLKEAADTRPVTIRIAVVVPGITVVVPG